MAARKPVPPKKTAGKKNTKSAVPVKKKPVAKTPAKKVLPKPATRAAARVKPAAAAVKPVPALPVAKNTVAYDSSSYASDYIPGKSIYQDDGRIFHRRAFTYDTVAEIVSTHWREGVLTLGVRGDSTATLSFTVAADNVLRMKMWRGAVSFDETSCMLLPAQPPAQTVVFIESPDDLRLRFGDYTLMVMKKPFNLRIENNAGEVVFQLETEYLAGQHVCPPLGVRTAGDTAQPFMSWRIRNNERFFGLGEKFGKVERSSTRATIWAADTCGSNTTDMSYKSLPVLFSTAGWGLMLHSSYRSFWEIGTFSYTAGACCTEDPRLDAFIFLNPTLKGLVGTYTSLTGRPSMPPLWAMGMWMSRCQYMNKEEVWEVVQRLRKEQIPCDVIHLDPKWMHTHWYFKIGVDACDFQWNEEGFPRHVEFLKKLRDNGYAVSFWLNPYLPEGTAIYDEAREKGYMCLAAQGGVARLEHGNPVGIVDFTNPAAKQWWKEKLKALVADGAWVFKPDYGDRVPEDALFHNGRTGKEMHNLYLHLYAETCFEAVMETRGEGMVWRRAGYIGSQRYPGTWAGDTQVTWEGMRCCMRGGLSAGFTGEAFWSHDIGGFTGEMPSEELYCRWAQFGLLSPLSRFHGAKPREPWHFGDTAIEVVRHYARLRYSLMPYLLAAAGESVRTGLPMMRHIGLEFPQEPNVETIDDQYLLGSDLLIAPVLAAGGRSRCVYFPEGIWTSLDNPLEVVRGGRFATVKAPLKRMPVFVREGTVLPRFTSNLQHLKGRPEKSLEVDVYPGTGVRTISFEYAGTTVVISAGVVDDVATLDIAPAPFDVVVNFLRFVAVSGIEGHPDIPWNATDGGSVFTVDGRNGVSVKLR